jgi:Xaa-Pro aminopeptidase
MSALLPDSYAPVFQRRRRQLASHLGTRAAIVFTGTLRGRNYPANTYPYRADSHFLYLVGAALPGAALLVHATSSGTRQELFVVPNAPDDALWHGTLPEHAAIAKATGVDRVRSIDELPRVIVELGGPAGIATLPSLDPHTRNRQRAMFGRPWPDDASPSIRDLHPVDLELADAMIHIRLTHDDHAIESIRTAVEGTTAAHLAGMRVTKPGIFEHDVRAAMERELLARGMEPAYGSIVTVHGEILHNNSYHHRLEPNDLLLADVGAEHQGWASDVTRTWPVSGKWSATQRAFYDIVLAANEAAISLVRPGVRYRDVHLRASVVLARGLVDEGILKGDPESLVERGAHALLFPHGVGHLLGLDVHDMEDLGDRAGYAAGRTRSGQFGLGYLRLDRDLRPGMIVTIEPGLYIVPAILDDVALTGPFVRDGSLDRERLQRFADVRGIRVEDDVLCTPTEPVVLTAAIPKAADQVAAAVGTA